MIHRELLCHPLTPCDALQGIAVHVARSESNLLLLRYVLEGAIAALRIPPGANSQRRDELWKQTCFEAFLKPGHGGAYCELNFSPSTDWAAYRFDGYRSGMRPLEPISAPPIRHQSSAQCFSLDASLDLNGPGENFDGARLGLSAVIEERNGRKSYWALAHPAGQPDFHHDDCFALDLPRASES